jgi:hypothetical protein
MTLLLIIGLQAIAQHQEVSEKPEMYKGKLVETVDTTSLLSAFKRGHFNGHFRYFFMSTQNQRSLSNYIANAVGGGIRFETAKFKNFQFAVSGFYAFNIGSSDLGKNDSLTGQPNRYEIALFDVENPYNYKDIDRLEEFYLRYNKKYTTITFGRMLINTPFINLQDGRMRPTGVEGIWMDWNKADQFKIEGGWIYAVSPRGTTKWYKTAESIGVYPSGINEDGLKSEYANALESKGVFTLSARLQVTPNIKVQAWNLFTENIFNTVMFQTDFNFPLNNEETLFAAAQVISQTALNNGGHEDATKSYFNKSSKSLTFGTKVGWKNKAVEASLNYNRITAKGRYLMPREWGRDPFFTFLPRERNEGFGDVHALLAKVNYNVPKTTFKTSLGVGYYEMPDVKNYKLNKYGLPSYTQINADFRYAFNKSLKGFETQLLIVGKLKNGETYNNKRFEFNKVNMVLYNFVINFHF